jgi:hypothetical protein
MGGSTDLHPVERSAIETPGVPDADRGWIDIEQAMLSRNAQEARLIRQSNLTVLPPTDDESTRTAQFVGLAHEFAVLDLEDYPSGHANPSSTILPSMAPATGGQETSSFREGFGSSTTEKSVEERTHCMLLPVSGCQR